MKRARPKNKKAELKKLKKEAKQAKKLENLEQSDIQPASKKPAKKKVGKVLLTIFVVLVLFLFVIMGFGLFDDSNILTPVENGKINVLLLGVDESGLRSDTIMVAAYDANEAKVNLLSIPRDTKVYIENRKITRKINEVHALSSKKNSGEIVGAEAMAEVVTQLTGIPINYYAEFSFSSIDGLFDTLGPVEFDVPDVEGNGRGMNYDDPYQNLHIHLKPGLQKLSGNQIQQFLRYRKSNYGVGTGSDTDRVARQQELFKAVVDQKVNLSILPKVPAIFSQISKEIVTNIQTGDITKYIRYIAKLSGESVTTYTLPGENKTLSGGSYFVVNLEETATMLKDVFGYEGNPTDKVRVSDEHSQKVLKAGNMNKKQDKTQQ
ncbi:MAG: LCP family protein, partial [Clostridia bacterium]|nr:LCP family protein [Clostridia bacterium]